MHAASSPVHQASHAVQGLSVWSVHPERTGVRHPSRAVRNSMQQCKASLIPCIIAPVHAHKRGRGIKAKRTALSSAPHPRHPDEIIKTKTSRRRHQDE
jgi:hypothetical protein